MLSAEREAEMQAARCNPELMALIEAQAKDAKRFVWQTDRPLTGHFDEVYASDIPNARGVTSWRE